MSNLDTAVVQPGGVSIVPPAIPVWLWPSTDTQEAPPPTRTRAGTPPGVRSKRSGLHRARHPLAAEGVSTNV